MIRRNCRPHTILIAIQCHLAGPMAQYGTGAQIFVGSTDTDDQIMEDSNYGRVR